MSYQSIINVLTDGSIILLALAVILQARAYLKLLKLIRNLIASLDTMERLYDLDHPPK